MFRKNEGYKQQSLFVVDSRLTKKQRKLWEKSREHKFFEYIFTKIDESAFSKLYSNKKSRPNVAVNQLVGSLILKHLYDWTYEELFTQLNFNLLTRHAIGINDIDEDVFSEASIFNFQNRISNHYVLTGEDMISEVFDKLTVAQLSSLEIKTSIQRGDSFLMGSNIMDYSRLNLLVEVLQRLFRILEAGEKEEVRSKLSPYLKKTSGQYIYKISKEELPKEMEKVGLVYYNLYELLKKKYEENEVFKMFERVYEEHFEIENKQVKVIGSKELKSDSLMSPDDSEATYRKKGKGRSKGYVGHLSETAHPENKINLITDIAVAPNNKDDASILEGRLGKMIEKTPDLEEYHNDGLYGSPEVDLIMEKEEIKQVQSTIRGRKSKGGMKMVQGEKGEVIVNCAGGQSVKAERKEKMWRAEFNYTKCESCPFKDECTTRITGTKANKPKRYMTFYDKVILCHKRMENINSLPEDRRTLRANVEATVKEAKRGIKNGKLRVRGLMKSKFYMAFTAIAINLCRIHALEYPRNRSKSEIKSEIKSELGNLFSKYLSWWTMMLTQTMGRLCYRF